MPAQVISLPYDADSAASYEKFLNWSYPIFLDSAGNDETDLIFAEPIAIYRSSAPQQYELVENGNYQLLIGSIWDALAERYRRGIAHSSSDQAGAIVGIASYDWGAKAQTIDLAEEALPLTWFGVYPWCIRINHQTKTCELVAQESLTKEKINAIISQFNTLSQNEIKAFKLTTDWQANFTQASYQQAFERIIDYLNAGDCYQVNLAQRFQAYYEGDPWQAYKQLRLQNQAPFSAFLKLDELSILSLSPERFLRFENNIVLTQPIKGTRPRSINQDLDAKLAAQLQESEKDKAENLMIVDLLRNDLSKTCEVGSVKVDELFAVQSFTAVHHLVSSISARLPSSETPLSCFSHCFPGGSITGAPKLRAMQIIEELEPNARSIYCGSIAYFGFDGVCDSNIAIRSLIAENHKILTWAGGGIVIESEWQKEYQETFDKIARITQVLRAEEAEADLVYPAIHANLKTLRHFFATQTRNNLNQIKVYDPDHLSVKKPANKKLVEAAVLVPIVAREKLSVLFTQRTAQLRSHSGQISFPGGKLDLNESVTEAALREAFEEIGLAREKIEIVGELPEHITGTGFRITPIVALVDASYQLTINEAEVAEAFEVPLDFLLNPENYSLEQLFWENKQRVFYHVPYENRGIWGATAAILFSFYEALLPSHTELIFVDATSSKT